LYLYGFPDFFLQAVWNGNGSREPLPVPARGGNRDYREFHLVSDDVTGADVLERLAVIGPVREDELIDGRPYHISIAERPYI